MDDHNENRVISSPSGSGIQQISVISDCRLWPENNEGTENVQFQMDHSPSQLGQREHQIQYDECSQDETNANIESQDIFREDRNEENELQMGVYNDTEGSSIINPDLMINIEGMGQEFLEIQQELNQKQNDLDMLTESAKLLTDELGEKQKFLESSKIEFLTEQDNYDNIHKKLDEEIELITAIGTQQEAMKNHLKVFLQQKNTVNTLLRNFEMEFNEMKANANSLAIIFQTKIDELKTILETVSKENIDNKSNKMKIIEGNKEIEAKLKLAVNNMEKMFGKLEVKHYQQTAILEYLKSKGNEEWFKEAQLQNELKSVEENGQQLINSEEKELDYKKFELNELSEELSELKNNIFSKKKCLENMIVEKNSVEQEVKRLESDQTAHLQTISQVSEELSETVRSICMLNESLSIKQSIDQENMTLKEHLSELKSQDSSILKSIEDRQSIIARLVSSCGVTELELCKFESEIEAAELLHKDLDSKRLTMIASSENIQQTYQEALDRFSKQKEEVEVVKLDLQNEIDKMKTDIENNQNLLNNEMNGNEKLKLEVLEKNESIIKMNQEANVLENKMLQFIDEYNKENADLNNKIVRKDNVKKEKEAEIDRRLALQCHIGELINELGSIEVQQREALENIKRDHDAEFKEKQDDYERRKNELESRCGAEKRVVAELQEELVDDQKKELHLVKSIQKLAHIKNQNREELIKLGNVTKTLDLKLTKIAHAITQWKAEKESTICTQDTVASSSLGKLPMEAPFTQSTRKTTTPPVSTYNDDSSSSGVSIIHDNNKAWKRKLLTKQRQKKQVRFLTPNKLDQDSSTDTALIPLMNTGKDLIQVEQGQSSSKDSQSQGATVNKKMIQKQAKQIKKQM